ncbi:unknown [Salmonella phage FelixO1]|uniref:Uncharacterized protein n=1 Tax=Salmonella phage Felix O1 (isolate Felix O1-VT1) TaxID=1283336 RepID=Q6KGL0_BPFO1|nr:unknown [Salmonella phage FelixO1]
MFLFLWNKLSSFGILQVLHIFISHLNLEHPEGIEPSTSVWKTVIFPFKLWMH